MTVTCLKPGATETEFFRRAYMEDTRVGAQEKDDPAAVARMGTLRFRTQAPMLGLAFTDNRTLAVGAWGEVVHLLALPEGKAQGQLDLPRGGRVLAASADGKLLAVATDGAPPTSGSSESGEQR